MGRSAESVHGLLNICEDDLAVGKGECDLRWVIARVVSRLPDSVQNWVLDETEHVFVATGHVGQYFRCFTDPSKLDWDDGRADDPFRPRFLRLIFLSDRLKKCEAQAEWTAAHEIAHSFLNHWGGREGHEDGADALARSWGFVKPPGPFA
jgi:hypothetical protein